MGTILIIIFVFFVIGVIANVLTYKKTDNSPNNKPEPKDSQLRKHSGKSELQEALKSSEFDWEKQETANKLNQEEDVLKSRGDGYELHIGRMFERKGDLVIYNGLLRGYSDQGVDIIVISKKDQAINLVQCKHWKRYEFTEAHLSNIYDKLSYYERDFDALPIEAIRHYLAIHFTDDAISELIQESQHYIQRKTLYLASDKVMTVGALSELTPVKENIYRYQDMKVVVSDIS